MTPLQGEMVANTMAMIASIIATELLDIEHYNAHQFQEGVARECRKVFRVQLENMRIITPDPKPPTKPHERKSD